MNLAKYYRMSELRELGWTNKLIKRYLGQPDERARNPVFANKTKMKMYLIARVKEVTEINSLEVILAANVQKKDSFPSELSAEAKRQEILKKIDLIQICLPKYEYPELIELACDHFNCRMARKGSLFQLANASRDTEFLYRITHNYLRHEESNYEGLISQLFVQVGRGKAYELLKDKVTREINDLYPDLLDYLKSRDNSKNETLVA